MCQGCSFEERLLSNTGRGNNAHSPVLWQLDWGHCFRLGRFAIAQKKWGAEMTEIWELLRPPCNVLLGTEVALEYVLWSSLPLNCAAMRWLKWMLFVYSFIHLWFYSFFCHEYWHKYYSLVCFISLYTMNFARVIYLREISRCFGVSCFVWYLLLCFQLMNVEKWKTAPQYHCIFFSFFIFWHLLIDRLIDWPIHRVRHQNYLCTLSYHIHYKLGDDYLM